MAIWVPWGVGGPWGVRGAQSQASAQSCESCYPVAARERSGCSPNALEDSTEWLCPKHYHTRSSNKRGMCQDGLSLLCTPGHGRGLGRGVAKCM